MVESRLDPSRFNEPGSSAESSTDLELERAIGDFVDWARHEVGDRPRELPALRGFGKAGDRIGDYELVRRLGVGGMGVVFEARQLSVAGRRVAIKLLRSVFVTDALARRFQREVETVAALEHRSIVPVVDARVDGGVPYYVMKFVDGLSASRLIRELRTSGSRNPTTREVRRRVHEASRRDGDEASSSSPVTGTDSGAWEHEYHRWVARVGLQLAEALQLAHENGVVHRDVKPANVMVTPGGRAVLLDFGLASVEGDESLTRSGQFLGTFRYASPEQLRGEATDARSDVYSLGATLFELATLRHPFDEEGTEGRRRTGEELPRPIDGSVPVDLRTILLRALAVSARRRYASAAALAADLRAFLAHRPIQARPPGLLERAARVVRRYPRALGAALALGAMSGALLTQRQLEARAGLREGEQELEAALVERDVLGALHAELERVNAAGPTELRARDVLLSRFTDQRGRVRDLFNRAENALLQSEEDHLLDGAVHASLARLYAERLETELGTGGDVLRPSEIQRLEELVRRYDRARRFEALQNGAGRVVLEARGEAFVRVWTGDGSVAPSSPPLHAGPLPADLELPAGSYVAVAEREDDGASVRVPFLVRRRGGVRSGTVVPIELPPLEITPAGTCFVPEGDALVVRDPAVWERVPGFYMKEHEVTVGELLDWCEALEDSPAFPSAGDLLAREWGDPREPVRGLTPMECSGIVNHLELVSPLPDGWIYDLPTRAEYVRAARGSDARSHPWGKHFSWDASVNYYSLSSYPGDAVPEPAGHNPRDVSPFGVHDLAGSVAEITSELFGPLPGEYLLFGGSFRSVEAEELSIDHRRRIPNEPRPDVGFRYVVRRRPDWFRQPDRAPEGFHEDFTRPDGDEVGGSWWESSGSLDALPTEPGEGRAGRLERGRMICEGGSGNFSESAELWKRIHVGEREFRVSVIASGRIDPPWVGTLQAARQFQLTLTQGPGITAQAEASLRFDARGTVELRWQDGNVQRIDRRGWTKLGDELEYELRVDRERIEARVRRQDGEVTSELRLPRPEGWRPRYLVIGAPALIGARLEVDEVRLELAE